MLHNNRICTIGRRYGTWHSTTMAQWILLTSTWTSFIEYLDRCWWGRCSAVVRPEDGKAIVSLPSNRYSATHGAVFSVTTATHQGDVHEHVVIYINNMFYVDGAFHCTPLDCLQAILGVRDVLSICMVCTSLSDYCFSPMCLLTTSHGLMDHVLPLTAMPAVCHGKVVLAHIIPPTNVPGYIMDIFGHGGHINRVIYTPGAFVTTCGTRSHVNLHHLISQLIACHVVVSIPGFQIRTGTDCTLFAMWQPFTQWLSRRWWGLADMDTVKDILLQKESDKVMVTQYTGYMAGGLFSVHHVEMARLCTSHVHFQGNRFCTVDRAFETPQAALSALVGHGRKPVYRRKRRAWPFAPHQYNVITELLQHMTEAMPHVHSWVGTTCGTPVAPTNGCVAFWDCTNLCTRGYLMSLVTASAAKFEIIFTNDGFELIDSSLLCVMSNTSLDAILRCMHVWK
ncbi:hypothetical protein [Banggai cardinalfish iridovirus]|uniref:Uncharacterized protein n=1 Tax=Banggai cardinalfish iridovirus TaxID=565290 RepID=A0A6M3QWP0_ISKNV|nr:hypothetical protein [Banggai cardinalfish iridovirus]UWH18868.1 ORF082 [Infectious spleen and kidney necrosis virus]WEP24621.1 hypothetical protein ORF082L [Largemouth bass ulcerative syndrome virus]